MECFGAEVTWSAATILVGIWISMLLLGRVCETVWVKPNRIRRKLRRQGIGGPRPSILFGNIAEMDKIGEESKPPPAGRGSVGVSHDWATSIFPFFCRWTQQYGQLYVYSRGNKVHLYVEQPDLLRELNLHKSLDLGKPSYMSEALEPMLGKGIIHANGHYWAFQRKLIAPEFFLSKLKGMVGLMSESTLEMIENWENQINLSDGKVLETTIDDDLKSVSADIISRTCFGSSYLQGKLIFTKLKAIQMAFSTPGLLFVLPYLRYVPTKRNREIWRLQSEIETLILKVVKDRENDNQKGKVKLGNENDKDLLQIILEGAVGQRMRTVNCCVLDICKTIYFAGHDTTALAASWCLMLLALHPDWQERVRAEILDIYGQAPHPHCFLDLDALHKLKTLMMVIQETLRLYGPAVVATRETFADITIGNLVLPKGIHIWSSMLSLHRDAQIWGVDANEFNPQRFSHGVSKACKHPQAYMPFGYGSRLCLGQTFAFVELKVILSLLLRRFSFSLSPNYRHSPVHKMLLLPEHGVQLLVKRV